MENFEKEKLKRAKKQIGELKGFYSHLAIYIVINTFILINIYLKTDDFWQWQHFVTLFAWGIGVFFHASKVFNYNPFFGRNWEERQIQKYIDKDKKEMDKYK
ncbi:2TM domain-containing protein [Flagellimonas hymeniacidonis]|uniref:2TM domain-containing protein n=1 Tax=Flagellimonas hymeniacidonis TaxID=2603628 RepID=A0A5C8V2H0_9FLAO|nr:2TM domain-containing protein [Flagellimonas hymeniacidonis]TXN35282.1 2TM domain-containing protein [Flagellimonas hymeniacidonis]